jgi:hypothetical protein
MVKLHYNKLGESTCCFGGRIREEQSFLMVLQKSYDFCYEGNFEIEDI